MEMRFPCQVPEVRALPQIAQLRFFADAAPQTCTPAAGVADVLA